MRWPLSIQVLARILLLLLVTVAAITYANIRLAIHTTRAQENSQVERITELFKSSRFPLTEPVLKNMKSLSGAEFVLTDNSETVISTTAEKLESFFPVSEQSSVVGLEPPYYHSTIANVSIPGNQQNGQLHFFVPRRANRSVWWDASKSPLLTAMIALPIALVVGFALSNQVTRPLNLLRSQVHKIAEGDSTKVPVNRVNDEIRDLATSVNEMSSKLRDQENELRKNERLKTLVQFGNSIAHHLRNSATGCKMAIELLATGQKEISDSKNYQVAIRQIQLMNNYIKKFLLLSKSSNSMEEKIELLDLAKVLDEVVFLVRPSAEHLNVKLTIEKHSDNSAFPMSRDDAEQLMMNLLTNAVTAANSSSQNSETKQAEVVVQLIVENGQFQFAVTDTGPGPPENIAEKLFQPFVTGSKEGTGLGLALVQEITSRLNGSIQWSRQNNLTRFVFSSDQNKK